MKKEKGFTLIEILVTIGIIGILSSVILAVLNTQKDKSNDTTIKSDLINLRNQANIIFDSLNGSYGNVAFTNNCGGLAVTNPATNVFNGAKSQEQIDDAVQKSGQATAKCIAANAVGYVIAVPLRSNPLQAWCFDHLNIPILITYANFTAVDASCVQAGT